MIYETGERGEKNADAGNEKLWVPTEILNKSHLHHKFL